MVVPTVTADGRVCRNCHEWKDSSWFRVAPGYKFGLFSWCRTCESAKRLVNHHKNPESARWRHVKYKYGIGKTDYDRMVDEQNGACAACGATEGQPRLGKGERYWLHIDHDHDTGEIRGLLCYRCNNGIGLLGTPKALRQAADYLERKGR